MTIRTRDFFVDWCGEYCRQYSGIM